MAWQKKKSAKKSKYSDLEKLAHNMGKIAKGVKDPNTKVYTSYQNGLKGSTKPEKPSKPLY